jgi:tRNA-specific 2-thiouridylase
VVDVSDQTLILAFHEPQRAITAGQSVVLYDQDCCLGGAIIAEAY